MRRFASLYDRPCCPCNTRRTQNINSNRLGSPATALGEDEDPEVTLHVDLDELLSELMAEFEIAMDAQREEMQGLFKVLDRNRDGTITLDEFQGAVQEMMPSMPPKKITRMFRKALEFSSDTDCLTPRSFAILAVSY